MASCTFNPNIDSSNPYAVLTVTEDSHNVSNNTSVVSWNLKLYRPYSISSSTAKNYAVVINGATVSSGTTTIGGSGTKTIASGTRTITHNSDGTKTISFSFSLDFKITWSGTYIGTGSASGSLALTTIPRASQPSLITYPNSTANIGNFGDTISIHMNRNSSSFTHRVRYEFGNLSGTCIDADTGAAATAVGTGFRWKIPESFMSLLPSSTSGSGRIYVDTYNGSTLIGTKYTGFTATVPASVKPSISSVTISEATSGLAAKFGAYIQSKSKLKVVTSAAGSYSSTIKSYAVKILGKTYSGSTITSDAITSSGSVSVAVTVTDSRGRTATTTETVTVVAYSKPSITGFTAQRCESDGTLSDEGEYVKLTYAFSVTTLSNKNDKSYSIGYKLKANTDYTTLLTGSVYTLDTTYVSSVVFSGDETYDFMLTVTDYFYSVTFIADVSTAFTLEDYHSSGTGKAYGKVAEKENTIENALSLNQIGNSYAFQPSAFNGEKGYTLLATIALNTLNVNAPIVFVINRRGASCPMTVYVRFASSSTSTDPDLGSITYEGDNYGAFLVKAATSTWNLYVDNTSGWSNPCLQKWYTTDNQMARLSVSFPQEQVATLPTPYYRATPVIMRSILDCFFPVGTIIQRYDHADPNTMFPGTTWVRLENTFLWGCDENGEIGVTGGSKTHTLTVNELPAHNHGGTYTNAGTSRTHAWLASNGSAMGYDSVNVGGGAAHNNMPPYTHVSIWRRTA